MDLENYLAKTKPNKSLRKHTDEAHNELDILKSLNYIDDRIYNLTHKAIEYHDYGKVNREFRHRIEYNSKFDDTKEIAHNILSTYFVKQDDFDSINDYYRVAQAVLNHHSYGDVFKTIEENEELINDLLNEFKEDITEIDLYDLNKIKKMIYDHDSILIKGLLQHCDYSSSAELKVEYKNDFLLDSLNNTKYEWNQLQQFCLENNNDNLIVTAQTGMGKTEAGLLWVGDNKGFFVLPLKTAINAIYDRVRSVILDNNNIEERVALLHSDSLSYYVKNIESDNVSSIEYKNRSKQLSIPLTITTLDQIFDFVFKYSGYEMKIATLSYSKLIIDEIQMYDAKLLAYLIYGISMITKFGGKVAILTATLSPFVRDLLREKGFNNSVKEETFTNNLVRHNVKVYNEKINSIYILNKYKLNKKYKKSNKILVVCNTVRNAQAIYKELKGLINNNELHILHNKFIKSDRTKKEDEIISFGKTYNLDGSLYEDSGIWISTSIVEASLDIDFDYLFTELSDLNGLLQRLGRCNRKGVKSVEDYNCFVFTEINKNILINGDKGFIDKTIYELSKKALENVNGKLTEDMKNELINKWFTSDKLNKSDYIRSFNDTFTYLENLNVNEYNKRDIDLRGINSETIIPLSIYNNNKDIINTYIKEYSNNDFKYEDRVSFLNELKKFTISVEPYIIDIRNKKSQRIECTLKIGKYEKIHIVDCNYTDAGFELKENKGYEFL